MSTAARVEFDQWKVEFSNALAGTAASTESADSLISNADIIARKAVNYIRERAAAADAEPEKDSK